MLNIRIIDLYYTYPVPVIHFEGGYEPKDRKNRRGTVPTGTGTRLLWLETTAPEILGTVCQPTQETLPEKKNCGLYVPLSQKFLKVVQKHNNSHPGKSILKMNSLHVQCYLGTVTYQSLVTR